MLFNGIDLEPYFRIKDIRGRGLVKRRINSIAVPGMDGEYVQSVDTPAKIMEVDIRIISENLRETIDELNDILATDTAVPIVFPDEPDMTYYGIVEDSSESGEKIHLGRHDTTIFIRRSDPCKYGEEQTLTFEGDTAIIENEGTAEAEPIFELEVLQDTTFAMVSNGEEYMMIGRPADALEAPKNTRPLILNDPASTLDGWSTFTSGFDFYGMGLVGGSMRVEGGYAFTPETWGTNPNGWTGPAIRKSLSEPLQDFEIEIDIAMLNHSTGVGTIRVVGLDANDKPVFSMGMLDSTNNYPNNRAIYGLGENNKIWFTYQGDHGRKVWNNGRFLLRISRKGKEFSARVARKLDPQGYEQTGRHSRTYTDTRSEYQNPITQIAVYIARARSFTNFEMFFHHLAVRKLINLADYEVPIIAREGDLITFDHKDAEAYINGMPVTEILDYAIDFGSDFFKLKKGDNTLAVLPEDTFDTTLRFRPPYR